VSACWPHAFSSKTTALRTYEPGHHSIRGSLLFFASLIGMPVLIVVPVRLVEVDFVSSVPAKISVSVVPVLVRQAT
jgi:hypothetical protein